MSLEWITGERISLVFQGAIGHKGSDFGPTVRGARAAMPDAEIILSTWDGATIDPAWPLDRVVFSPDPGPVFVEPIAGRPNNVLRQATSTFAGLQAATRPFAAKIRTDFMFAGEQLPIAGTDANTPEIPLFERPVTVPIIGTRDATTSGWSFHPSDFFSFGTRADLLKLWNFHRPLEVIGDATVGFATRLRTSSFGVYYYRIAPEQEIILSLLIRAGRAGLARRIADRDPTLAAASFDFLRTNFRVFTLPELGLTTDPRLTGAIMITRNVGAGTDGRIVPGTRDAPAWIAVEAFLQNALTLAATPFGYPGRRALATLVAPAKRMRAWWMARSARHA